MDCQPQVPLFFCTGMALKIAVPAGAAALLLMFSLLQALGYRADLPAYILAHGRIVLSSGDFVFPQDDAQQNGSARRVQDGRGATAAILRFPADHPHGTFLLLDTALTHSPAKQTGASRVRRPEALLFYSGPCVRCEAGEFRRYARLKRVRIDLLHRRANNPDEVFVIPDARPVYSLEVTLEDRPGPQRIALNNAPTPAPAADWPAGMHYIITRLQILEVYPGQEFTDRFALTEVVYSDRDGAAEQPFVYQQLD